MSTPNFIKNIGQSKKFQGALGRLLGNYLSITQRTNRFDADLPQALKEMDSDRPVIAAVWHGQHFSVPLINRPQDHIAVLVSASGDGTIFSIACDHFGVRAVRGSGDAQGRFDFKGGIGAFREMMQLLEQGYSIILTADFPKRPRRVSMGLVKLAQLSGRPIYPGAVVTSRRFTFNNWDRTTVPMPFGRGMVAIGSPIRVAKDADRAAQDAARRATEDGLDDAHRRAYASFGEQDPGALLRNDWAPALRNVIR